MMLDNTQQKGVDMYSGRLAMSSENINWWIQYYYNHPDERMGILKKGEI